MLVDDNELMQKTVSSVRTGVGFDQAGSNHMLIGQVIEINEEPCGPGRGDRTNASVTMNSEKEISSCPKGCSPEKSRGKKGQVPFLG